ncbi:uncharacterized protein LOC109098335 [Tachysurus ichikawai]
MVKTSNGMSKAYIALFTCAVTRAIHLELVSSQSTENFLLALKRFIARRGLCKVIYSDNAKTFKRADQDLKELWKSIKEPDLRIFFAEKRITWKYIVKRAAWWGGFWERLVRSTKSCLKRILAEVLKVGDVILVAQQTWKTGKIEDIFLGRDGLKRTCSVRTSLGTVLRRPVQLLYPLEISDT